MTDKQDSDNEIKWEETYIIPEPPELSEWTCHLFGSGGEGGGISWTPAKNKEPNWFWRKMQYICLGNKWVKNK